MTKQKRPTREGNAADPATKEAFMMFCSVPKSLRPKGMKTQKDFAKKYGVNESTLSDWKLQEGWNDHVYEQTKAFFRSYTPEVMEALYNGATSQGPGSNADRKLWLQTLEKFAEKHEASFPELAGVHKTLLAIVEKNKRPKTE